jgi:hypothetical protein
MGTLALLQKEAAVGIGCRTAAWHYCRYSSGGRFALGVVGDLLGRDRHHDIIVTVHVTGVTPAGKTRSEEWIDWPASRSLRSTSM